MRTCNERRGRIARGLLRHLVATGLATFAMVILASCGSKGSGGGGTGGSSAPGGRTGGGGGDSGRGGVGPGGGGSGGGGGGQGGAGGEATGGAPGTGGHEISPVVCGSVTCPLTDQCCVACDGARTCAPACSSPVCPDAGAGGAGGMGPADAGPPDGGIGDAGSLSCGTMTCGPQEACVHPPGPGTCLMPDGGQCPGGTSLVGTCCLPPLVPTCVAIDRPCTGPALTCACFSSNPCAPQLCVGASFNAREVFCHGA